MIENIFRKVMLEYFLMLENDYTDQHLKLWQFKSFAV